MNVPTITTINIDHFGLNVIIPIGQTLLLSFCHNDKTRANLWIIRPSLEVTKRLKYALGLKFEELTRKLRDTERKVRELERKGSHQTEYEAKVAEMQAEIDEKVRQNRRLTENLDKTTERFEIVEEELKKLKGTVKESESRKGQEARRRDQLGKIFYIGVGN